MLPGSRRRANVFHSIGTAHAKMIRQFPGPDRAAPILRRDKTVKLPPKAKRTNSPASQKPSQEQTSNPWVSRMIPLFIVTALTVLADCSKKSDQPPERETQDAIDTGNEAANPDLSLADINSQIIKPLASAFEVHQALSGLNSNNPDVRLSAINELGNINVSKNVPPDLKIKMIESLIAVQIDAGSLRDAVNWLLTDFLGSDNVAAPVKSQIIQSVIALLISNNEDIRFFAATRSSCFIRSTKVPIEFKTELIEPLIEKLGDASFKVQGEAAQALEALARLTDLPAGLKGKMIDPLIRAMEEHARTRRNQLGENVDSWGAASNIARTLTALVESDIAYELKIKIIDGFLACLSIDKNNSGGAAEALKNLAGLNIPVNLKVKIVSSLIEGINGINWHVKKQEAYHLLLAFTESDIPSELKIEMIEPLKKGLNDSDFWVRNYSVYALANIINQVDVPSGLKMEVFDRLVSVLSRSGGGSFVDYNYPSPLHPHALRELFSDPLIIQTILRKRHHIQNANILFDVTPEQIPVASSKDRGGDGPAHHTPVTLQINPPDSQAELRGLLVIIAYDYSAYSGYASARFKISVPGGPNREIRFRRSGITTIFLPTNQAPSQLGLEVWQGDHLAEAAVIRTVLVYQ